MPVEIKAIIALVSILISWGCLFYLLDLLLKREALRQFYRDLVRLVILYENNDLLVCSHQVPKILGSRITRFHVYEAVIKDLSNAYEAGLTDYHSMLAYVLSLHRSYCFSNRDLIKFKNKLCKEKS